MNYNLLKALLDEKRINVPALANEIGMSKAGLYQAIDKERLTVDTLEKISSVLNVPVSYFFNSGSQNELEDLQKELDDTKERLALLTNQYKELEIKNEYILKISFLNEKLVESASKDNLNYERMLYTLFYSLHKMERYASRHIRNSFILANPEESKKYESQLWNKYCDKDPLTKEITKDIRYIKPFLKENLIEFPED